MGLVEEYKSRMTGCEERRRVNDRVAKALYAVALLASGAAAIAAAVGSVAKEVVAVLAAIPGVITLALSTFRPDARAQWWNAKYGKLDDLVLAMRFENKGEADASQEFRKFLEIHEPKYPGVGNPPSGSAA